jgi:putative oxidoreductase
MINLDRFAPQFLSVLRIVAGLLFFLHGPQKLFGFPPSPMSPPFFSIYGVAAILELVGGLMIMVGFFTRPVAFVMSGLMAFAYFLSHAPRSFFPTSNGGDAAILYCFLFLYLVFAGPGPWSLDARKR